MPAHRALVAPPAVFWWVLAGRATALLGAALALAAATLWLATEPAPRVIARASAIGGASQLQRWLRQHDPRRHRDGQVLRLVASADELNLIASQAAQLVGGVARTQLGKGRLRLQASLPLALPGRTPWRWLNLDLELGEGQALAALPQSLQVGRLRLPAPLTGAALRVALWFWDPGQVDAPPLHTAFDDLQLQPQRVLLRYRWRADLPQRLLRWLMPADRLRGLQPYRELLAAELRHSPGRHTPVALPGLMAPLFKLAQLRSGQGADPVHENRAALLVLAAYTSGQPAARWWPQANSVPVLPRRPVELGGRGDFAQHFALSAALAAEGGGPLADALGLMKELGDTRGGSGFSFTDIAVNRAGSRLGEMAVRQPQRVQALLAHDPAAADLLPAVSDLPEFMSAAEFRARFGAVGAPAYEAMRADIEARISALALYR